MKWFILFLVALPFSACNSEQKQRALNEKETALNQKEQELIQKERNLQLKEEEILRREQNLDSANRDSTQQVNAALVGNWSVKMTCTETTCAGSAVGDTKTEQWDVAYQGNSIIARAKTGENLVRVYTGLYTGNTVELVESRESNTSEPASKMVVRLRVVNEKTMEGQREIIRDNNCKVVYAMQMEKL